MAYSSGQEKGTQEEKEILLKKKEEQRQKQEKEKREYEDHLQRLRNLIKEDRKNNLEKAQIEIDGLIAMQTVSLKNSHIRPLTANRDTQTVSPNSEEIRIKIIHDTKKKLHILKTDATVGDLKNILKTDFGIKKPKAFISTAGEIDFSTEKTLLKDIGVSDMDTIYVHSL
ncbi:hypothetical protein NEPAR06_0333 [Nematocida parisii]|uniref:uncharacterized protein n=1 Tax=Nematocida parisii (strain ERTm1 / ATCC PRA-289) TaxID=881290 RepID=UPI000264B2E9|nr:uncharacterized protein NEPG_01245 [Nematocida parisii ERTm1]EIJ93673.1 hypothetical protein NEPG_01245 [Nematocida parisii ERTm1]KAI5142320.1 hypothetical protein NEPAR07_0062 [Nematocida parisii]KAI5153297.1 hypothetical protein NEPAR06_0333 [Nematocida parisii]KAI5155677.1 hypothetical protein NEPAR05_0048 [Nematocida parisii]|eukprot:XP_013059073.1 hypothetical protein NEPG_01245 [Nematocida parisii ERTm1]